MHDQEHMTSFEAHSRMVFVVRRTGVGLAAISTAVEGFGQTVALRPAANGPFRLRACLHHIETASGGHWTVTVVQPRPSSGAWHVNDAAIAEISVFELYEHAKTAAAWVFERECHQ
jgi:hypothetical protein